MGLRLPISLNNSRLVLPNERGAYVLSVIAENSTKSNTYPWCGISANSSSRSGRPERRAETLAPASL